MNATCAECGSVFRVDPAKVPSGGVRARCSVCGGVFAIAAVPPRAAAPVHSARPGAATGGVAGGAAGAVPQPPPAVPTAAAAAPSVRQATPAATSPAPASGLSPAEAPAQSSATDAPPAPPPAVVEVPTAAAPAAPPPAAASAPRPPEPPRRPVNPYLSADPGARARRLARALVSDLVAYYPAKREEGLRDGTLKQLFREEIKKSWEEYVEQVGAQVAESTTHFQDALNDILAGGRKVF